MNVHVWFGGKWSMEAREDNDILHYLATVCISVLSTSVITGSDLDPSITSRQTITDFIIHITCFFMIETMIWTIIPSYVLVISSYWILSLFPVCPPVGGKWLKNWRDECHTVHLLSIYAIILFNSYVRFCSLWVSDNANPFCRTLCVFWKMLVAFIDAHFRLSSCHL